MAWDSEVEWREAAIRAHYRYEDFQLLSGEQQAAHIAHYRIYLQAEALMARERLREANRPRPHR